MAATIQELLERGVLFDRVEVPYVRREHENSLTGLSGHYVMVPDKIYAPRGIRLFCTSSKCEDTMDWFLARDRETEAEFSDLSHAYSTLQYRCRHTPDDRVDFFLSREDSRDTAQSVFQLVGRHPRPAPYLTMELQKALGEINRDRYSKALHCRSEGLGIAALAYMRRVVEGEMDRLIDLIVETLPEEDNEIRDSLLKLKGAYQFAEKAVVADAKLPSSFFPGSQNPFARLHDLSSDGVHNLDDVESAQRFDECRELFEMLFEKLLRDRQTQRLYRERLTSLKRKLSK